jgi:hypothetical protein
VVWHSGRFASAEPDEHDESAESCDLDKSDESFESDESGDLDKSDESFEPDKSGQ